MLTLLLAFVFIATAGACIGGVLFVDRRRLAAADAIRERLAMPIARDVLDGDAVRLVRGVDRHSGFAFLDRWLTDRSLSTRIGDVLRRAGLTFSVGEFLLASAAAGAAALAVGTVYLGPLVGLAAAPIGAMLPRVVVWQRTRARVARLEAQLPEALDAIVNSLKAGHSFPAALEYSAGEVPAPLGPELARVRDEQRLGVESRTALEALAARVETSDMRMFVTAVLIQRETGGNLAELLQGLATLVRERAAFRGRVAALTAEPRISAIVLALLPVVLLVLLSVLNPDYIRPMYTTTFGHMLLGAAGVLSVIGYFVMRSLGDVEF